MATQPTIEISADEVMPSVRQGAVEKVQRASNELLGEAFVCRGLSILPHLERRAIVSGGQQETVGMTLHLHGHETKEGDQGAELPIVMDRDMAREFVRTLVAQGVLGSPEEAADTVKSIPRAQPGQIG